MTITKYKAAAVTSEPGVSHLCHSLKLRPDFNNVKQWFNLEEGVQKTIKFIDEAGEAGCKLVAFPEVCEYSRKLPRHPT